VDGENAIVEAIDREGHSLDKALYSRERDDEETLDVVPQG